MFKFKAIETDSRKIKEGSLFVALKGEKFNGEDFAKEAVEKGAIGVVVSVDCPREKLPTKGLVLKVDDPLATYQSFARACRGEFEIPVVAITGSTGKTTTKDLTAAVFSEFGEVLKTTGNYNNEIGVPLTLLAMEKGRTAAAVIEIGMRGLGQIKSLAKIVNPTIGIVTNVNETHIELLGSIENIAKAKSELVESIEEGAVVLNADDDRVYQMREKAHEGVKVITYGFSERADVRGFNVIQNNDHMDFVVKYGDEKENCQLQLLGEHNVLNALAAIGAGIAAGLTLNRACAHFSDLAMTKGRFELKQVGGLKFIDDTYNASPASMRAAIVNTSKIAEKHQNKIAVLGGMLELGEHAEKLHKQVGREVFENDFAYLITCGELAKFIADGAREAGMSSEKVFSADTQEKTVEFLKSVAHDGDIVLLKGSRGFKMERVLEIMNN